MKNHLWGGFLFLGSSSVIARENFQRNGQPATGGKNLPVDWD